MRKTLTISCSACREVDASVSEALENVGGDLVDYRVVPVEWSRSLIVTIVYEDHQNDPPIRVKMMG